MLHLLGSGVIRLSYRGRTISFLNTFFCTHVAHLHSDVQYTVLICEDYRTVSTLEPRVRASATRTIRIPHYIPGIRPTVYDRSPPRAPWRNPLSISLRYKYCSWMLSPRVVEEKKYQRTLRLSLDDRTLYPLSLAHRLPPAMASSTYVGPQPPLIEALSQDAGGT